MFHMKSKILCLLLALLALPIFAELNPCEEYKLVNMNIIPCGRSSVIYYLTTNNGAEIPCVDSVLIENTEHEPLRKLDAQSGDTIDVSFLEKQGHYILRVYIGECMLSKTFVYRVISTDLENNTTSLSEKRKFFYYKGVLYYEAPDGKRYDILGRKL